MKTKGKEEESLVTYHGVVYVDLAPLLYPGVSKIRGAYLVRPFNETELEEKMVRKSCLDDTVMKRIIGSSTSINQAASQKPAAGGKQARAETRVKPSVPNIKGVDPVGENVDQPQESQEYLEAKTYITLEIQLEKPLVERRKPEQFAARVAELIPPHPTVQKKQCGSKKAVDDFEKQIFSSSNMLLEEFRTMFGAVLSKEKGGEADERRKAFLYELNQSG